VSYNNKELKVSNINYLNKDFVGFKDSLIKYAQSYFPNSYKDFNETSPGMMLIEMSAYVGDVLSFYIDQQYREMLLPLAEERKNVINIAKMLGYKVKPTFPSFATLTFKQTVAADTSNINDIKPKYTEGVVLNKGLQVQSSNDPNLIFETLDYVDFQTTGSYITDTVEQSGVDATSGLVNQYTISRKVKAVSGESKTKTFQISSPTKFLKLTLPETDVINIESCIDSNGNTWYEVDYLAQERIPLIKHYTDDSDRTNAYSQNNGGIEDNIPVPYSLEYISTNKRFITETNSDNTTSLVFGNGILRSGQEITNNFIQLEQVGISVPGSPENLTENINPLLGDDFSTLGESPAHTTLTVTYRTGGGVKSNVASGDIITIVNEDIVNGSLGSNTLTVENESPARGGASEASIEEIRQRAIANFTTQNRCVTKEDYEARVLSLPAQFGKISKVYVRRSQVNEFGEIEGSSDLYVDLRPYLNFTAVTSNESPTAIGQQLFSSDTSVFIQRIQRVCSQCYWAGHGHASDSGVGNNEISGMTPSTRYWRPVQMQSGDNVIDNPTQDQQELQTMINMIEQGLGTYGGATSGDLPQSGLVNFGTATNMAEAKFGTLEIFITSYDSKKNLIGDVEGLPTLLVQNLKNYLSQFRIITDDINIYPGKIINFGVAFEVVAQKHANKQEVKLKCIDKIINYFNIDKMQFKKPLYTSDLNYELMGVDGVRSVNYVELTQYQLSNQGAGNGEIIFIDPLYDLTWDPDTNSYNQGQGTDGYGYFYDFNQFYSNNQDGGTILPSIEPSVFELKNPRQNVKGRVL